MSEASPDTPFGTSPTISVSAAPGARRYGLVPLPTLPLPPGPTEFIRSAELRFNVVSCSNVPPEVEIRRAPRGFNSSTGAESAFHFMTATWNCSNDAAGPGTCESGPSGATWSDIAREPVIARRSCPEGLLGPVAAFDVTGDFAAAWSDGRLADHPGYVLTVPSAVVSATLPSDVELEVDHVDASFVPVLPSVPALDRSRVTHVLDAYGFMRGTVMFGGTIDERRAAHLRGRVRRLVGGELADVAGTDVRILGRSDAPVTRTRADAGAVGTWDLLVNGGGQVTVTFTAPGYVTAQRVVDVGWNDEVVIPDVVLVPEPTCVAVDGGNGTVVTHPDWSVMDDRGTRSIVVYVPPGTSVRSLDGGTDETNFEVCFGELTRRVDGAGDLELMPADVATGTAYTFAAEGQVRVNGDRIRRPFFAPTGSSPGTRSTISVYLRTDEFVGVNTDLDLPVGATVPVGTYDERRGAWGAEEDGAVVQVNPGADCIQTNGAPVTISLHETATVCSADGAFPDASRYMRVPTGHFSAIDFNLLGLIDFLEDIFMSGNDEGSPESCQSGSIIHCERRALSERIPIHGTPFSLAYHGANQAGRTSAYTVRVEGDGSGSTLPVEVNYTLEVAGRRVDGATAALGEPVELTWDGNDAFLRRMLGPQRADVWIEYVFDTRYICATPAGSGRSFADRLAGFTVGTSRPGLDLCGSREARLRYRRTTWLGTTDDRIRSLGGWAIAQHHIYDPVTRVLSMGSGERRTEVSNGWVVSAIGGLTGSGLAASTAPDGTVYLATTATDPTYANRLARIRPDGTVDPVFITTFTDITGIAAGPDGELYVGRAGSAPVTNDGCIGRLRSWTNSALAFEPVIGQCGVVSTSVPNPRAPLICDGCGTPHPGPDGVTSARVHEPSRMAVAPDGTLVYVERRSGLIDQSLLFYRELSTSRSLNLFRRAVGTEELGPVTFDRAGRLHWSLKPAGEMDWEVRRLDDDAALGGFGSGVADGRVVVGGGANFANGVLATGPTGLQLFELRSLGVLPTGEIVMSQPIGSYMRVRMVGLDGRVRTIAGCSDATTSDCADATASGRPARRVRMNTTAGLFAVTPEGRLVVPVSSFGTVLLEPALSSNIGAVHRIASSDATVIYDFDEDGRHAATRDAITNTPLVSFAYDSTGRLTQVTDAEGAPTTVTYPSANEIRITAPGANVTTINLTSGYAASITSGARTWTMNLGSDGLLTALREPGHSADHVFTHPGGLLETDVDLQDNGMAGGPTIRLGTPVSGEATLLRPRIEYGAGAQLLSSYRWGTVSDPASPSAGAWQRVTDTFRVHGTSSISGVEDSNPRMVLTSYPEEYRVDQQIVAGTTFAGDAVTPGTTVSEIATTRVELAGDPRFDMEAPYARRSRFCLSSAACADATSAGWNPADEMVVEQERTWNGMTSTLEEETRLRNALDEISTRTIAPEGSGRVVTFDPPGSAYPPSTMHVDATGLARVVEIPGQHRICIDYTGRRLARIRQGEFDVSGGVCSGAPSSPIRRVTLDYHPTRRWLTGVTTGTVAGGGTQTTTFTPDPDRGWPEEIRLPGRSSSNPVLIQYYDTGNTEFIEGPGRGSAGRYRYTFNGRDMLERETTPLGAEIGSTLYTPGRAVSVQTLGGSGSIAVGAWTSSGLPELVTATQALASDSWEVAYDDLERPTRLSHVAAAYGSRPGDMDITYRGPLPESFSWSTSAAAAARVVFDYEVRTLRLASETVEDEGVDARIGYTYAPNSAGSVGNVLTGSFARNDVASLGFGLVVPTPSPSAAVWPAHTLTVNSVATTTSSTRFGETAEIRTGTPTAPWFVERICARDNHGRVTRRAEWVRTGASTFERTRYAYFYDGAGRLTGTSRYRSTGVPAPTAAECPLAGGTLIPGSLRLRTYNDAGIRSDLTAGIDDQVTTGSRTYDARGRLSNRGPVAILARGFQHDVLGRLRRSTRLSTLPVELVRTTFEYDPLGRLSHIDPNGVPDDADDEYFWYRDGLRPIAWQRGVGPTAVHAYFVYVTRPNVPDLMYVDNGGTAAIDFVYRLLVDERGSPRAVLRVDGTPSIVQRISYDEWGVPTLDEGVFNLHPFTFAGGIRMAATGLVHFGARNYDPSIGQWVEKDPIEYAGGTGPYLYCENDPVNCVDPTGLFIPGVAGAIGGGLGSFATQGGFSGNAGNVDWGQVAYGAAVGAVWGMAAPAFGLFGAIALGAGINTAAYLVGSRLFCYDVTPGGLATAGVLGGAAGGLGSALSGVARGFGTGSQRFGAGLSRGSITAGEAAALNGVSPFRQVVAETLRGLPGSGLSASDPNALAELATRYWWEVRP